MVSKIIETVVADRLNHHLEVNYFSEPYESAYKRHHSCETARLCIQNGSLCALVGRQSVVLLLLDLSPAFDTVEHNIIFQRMSNKFGIKEKALDWFRSYLAERSQSRSDIHNVTCGVPQGSVLGAIFY